MTYQKGFTLIEMLVVIAIIGILSGIFGWNLLRSIRSAELREATTNFASDLRRARSQAQRGSADMVVALPSGTAEVTQYTVSGKTIPVANRVKMICKSGCSATEKSLTYQAPFGELDRPQGYVFEFISPMSDLNRTQVKVVGVTGKVIIAGGGS